MIRWSVVSAAVVVGFLAGAVVFPRAQERISESVSVRHIDPDAGSRPLPLLSPGPSPHAVLHDGGVYEIYFNGPVYVPGLGPRQKLFVLILSTSVDGWYKVGFGDTIENKGQSDAHVVPVYAPDLEPQTALQWNIYYASIAAASPDLNASGVDSVKLQHWPE
jgi:hypothetical protein